MAQTLLKVAADFETALDQQVDVGDETCTFISYLEADGVTLPDGTYGFTIDGDSENYKEFIIGSKSGTTIGSIKSITVGGVPTTGFTKYHRRGALVTQTDWASLLRITNVLDGTTSFDASTPLGYDGAPTISSGNQFATKTYVDDNVNGGTVSFDQQVISSQTAGENLTSRNLVYFKQSDQKWWKVDADDTSTFIGVRLGVALSTVLANATLQIAISGPVTGFAGLTAGNKVYASGTAGAVVSTAPSAPTYEVFVGWALSTTVLMLVPNPLVNQLEGSSGVPSSANQFVTEYSLQQSETDQSQSTQDTSQAVGEADATTRKNKLGQSFVPTYNRIRGVKLYKSASTGTFAGTITISLQADSAGAPSGASLATTTILNAAYEALPVGEFTALFSSEYASLVPGNTYWIVISTSTADNANHPNVGSNTAGGYANGLLKLNNTTDGWVTIAGQDLYFKTINGTSGVAATVGSDGYIPTRISQYAFVELNLTDSAAITSNVETTVYTKSVGSLSANGGFHLVGHAGDMDIDAGETCTIRIKYSGTTIATAEFGTTAGQGNAVGRWEAHIINTAQAAQSYISTAVNSINFAAVDMSGDSAAYSKVIGEGTATVDTSSPVTITVTYQLSDASGSSITHRAVLLERIG